MVIWIKLLNPSTDFRTSCVFIYSMRGFILIYDFRCSSLQADPLTGTGDVWY